MEKPLGWWVCQIGNAAVEVFGVVTSMTKNLVTDRTAQTAPAINTAFINRMVALCGQFVIVLNGKVLSPAVCPEAQRAYAALVVLQILILREGHPVTYL